MEASLLDVADSHVTACRDWAITEPKVGVRVLRPGARDPLVSDSSGGVCRVAGRGHMYRVSFIPFVTFCGNEPVRSVIEPPAQSSDGTVARPVFRVHAAPGIRRRRRTPAGLPIMCSLVARIFAPTAVHYVSTPDPAAIRVVYQDPPTA